MKKKFKDVVFYKNSYADKYSNLGKNVVLFENSYVLNSTIDRFTYIQSNSNLYNCEIGAFCSIASNVTIGLASHPIDMVSTSPIFYDNTQPLPKFFINNKIYKENMLRTIIGADVWIGQGVMIKAGVTIGTGSIIGAGSVVTKDIQPYSIVGGVPAKLIKKRFDDVICDKLLQSKWWELPSERLIRLSENFTSPKILLDSLKNRC